MTTLAIGLVLMFGPASMFGPSPALAATSQFDMTIEKGKSQKAEIDKNKKQDKWALYAVCAATPGLVWKAFDNSRKIREAEQVRVKDAIDNLETMRDEWMDVQGKASSDEDMFTGLAARQEEIDEVNEVESQAAAEKEAVRAEEEAKAMGLDLDELFDETKDDAPPAKPPAAGSRSAVDDEDGAGEGERLASSDDVERLKRMFGSS